MDFCAEWLNNLLCSMDKNCDSCLFESCANLHYKVNGMDNILEKYVGNLPEFISFLEKEWGWKITYSEDESQLLVDENKDFCVCPITQNVQGKVSGMLCNCSEKFAEQMFSKVCKKKIAAKVKRSILRDGKSCIYEISI
ncbi:MAG: hypothetical protein K2N85_08645 [Lachnospiraceae bacterium]|nr:hypothetical protein [Lachnospiraceae bacterium]